MRGSFIFKSQISLRTFIWGFPKIVGTLLGFSIVRTIVFWGLYWGPPSLGNYHTRQDYDPIGFFLYLNYRIGYFKKQECIDSRVGPCIRLQAVFIDSGTHLRY